MKQLPTSSISSDMDDLDSLFSSLDGGCSPLNFVSLATGTTGHQNLMSPPPLPPIIRPRANSLPSTIPRAGPFSPDHFSYYTPQCAETFQTAGSAQPSLQVCLTQAVRLHQPLSLRPVRRSSPPLSLWQASRSLYPVHRNSRNHHLKNLRSPCPSRTTCQTRRPRKCLRSMRNISPKIWLDEWQQNWLETPTSVKRSFRVPRLMGLRTQGHWTPIKWRKWGQRSDRSSPQFLLQSSNFCGVNVSTRFPGSALIAERANEVQYIHSS